MGGNKVNPVETQASETESSMIWQTSDGTSLLPEGPVLIPGGYILTDGAGIILDCDHGSAVLLQASRRTLVGKNLVEFFGALSQERFSSFLKELDQTDNVHEWVGELKQRNHQILPISLSVCRERTHRGETVGLRWLVRDVSLIPTIPELFFRAYRTLEQHHASRVDEVSTLSKQLEAEIARRRQMEKALQQAQEEFEARVKKRTSEMAMSNELLQSELNERKRAERAADRRAVQLSALHNATKVLLTTLDLETLLGQILDAANIAIPGVEKGMLHMIAHETGQLEIRAAIGYNDPRIKRLEQIGERGYLGKVVRLRTPLLIHDVRSDPSVWTERKIPGAGIPRSVIVAPLILNDQVLGVLSLESEKKAAFTDDDLKLLVSFAATATIAIRNAQLHAEVQHLAITDPLTGLYNRRGFYEMGKREFERSRRFGRPLTALMIDLDHFKTVNDSHGHEVGDLVIRGTAERIALNVREFDIVGRYGGDEYILLLSETDLFTASKVAERLRETIQNTPIHCGELSVVISTSIGVARLNTDIHDLNALISKADAAMYMAKEAGRNRVSVG